MSLVERMRGSIERRRDPLINPKKLEELVDEGRSPRVVASSVDYETGEADFALMIPPPTHSWEGSEVVPLEPDEGVALFVREETKPLHAIIRQADRTLITHLQANVPDLFAFVDDPFAPPASGTV